MLRLEFKNTPTSWYLATFRKVLIKLTGQWSKSNTGKTLKSPYLPKHWSWGIGFDIYPKIKKNAKQNVTMVFKAKVIVKCT